MAPSNAWEAPISSKMLKTNTFNPNLCAWTIKPAPDLQEHSAAHLKAVLFPSWAPARTSVTMSSSTCTKSVQSLFPSFTSCWGRSQLRLGGWVQASEMRYRTGTEQAQAKRRKANRLWLYIAILGTHLFPIPLISPECLHLPPPPKHRGISSEYPHQGPASLH